MAAQVTNYKCPACTGPLHFAGSSGKLECDYCGESYDIATIEAMYAQAEETAAQAPGRTDWDYSAAGSGWSGPDATNMRTYSCPSCSAEMVCDETTAATSCPYCGNPAVVPGQFHGVLRPDFIIPFRLDREAAKAALQNHYKGKKFLPKSFSQSNHTEEIKGIYVPFWLYDADSAADMQFEATVSHTHRSGNEEITTTDHYQVIRQGSLSFEKVPVDGASQMPDTHMDAIEPFDYGDLREFSFAYLPGFLASKYDEDMEACSQRANERIRNSTQLAFEDTVEGYHTVQVEHAQIALQPKGVGYALFPVWMLSTRWKDKNFLFAMNGQTGKLIGDLPVDRGRFWAWFAGISLPLMALLAIVLFVLGG